MGPRKRAPRDRDGPRIGNAKSTLTVSSTRERRAGLRARRRRTTPSSRSRARRPAPGTGRRRREPNAQRRRPRPAPSRHLGYNSRPPPRGDRGRCYPWGATVTGHRPGGARQVRGADRRPPDPRRTTSRSGAVACVLAKPALGAYLHHRYRREYALTAELERDAEDLAYLLRREAETRSEETHPDSREAS